MYSHLAENVKYSILFNVNAVVESYVMRSKIFLYVQYVIKSKYFILVFKLTITVSKFGGTLFWKDLSSLKP